MNFIKARLISLKKGVCRRLSKKRTKVLRKAAAIKRRVSSSMRKLMTIRCLRMTMSEFHCNIHNFAIRKPTLHQDEGARPRAVALMEKGNKNKGKEGFGLQLAGFLIDAVFCSSTSSDQSSESLSTSPLSERDLEECEPDTRSGNNKLLVAKQTCHYLKFAGVLLLCQLGPPIPSGSNLRTI